MIAGQWLQKARFGDAQVSLNGLGGSYLPKVEKLEIGTIQKLFESGFLEVLEVLEASEISDLRSLYPCTSSTF